MIATLFLIAGINSTTNLKHMSKQKEFSPANTQSSSEESLKEKCHTFIGIYSFSLTSKCKY